jgi:hypothetical protein
MEGCGSIWLILSSFELQAKEMRCQNQIHPAKDVDSGGNSFAMTLKISIFII